MEITEGKITASSSVIAVMKSEELQAYKNLDMAVLNDVLRKFFGHSNFHICFESGEDSQDYITIVVEKGGKK
jgi:hypothetical protein